MSLESNSSVLYDASGNPVAGAGGIATPTSAVLMGGQDGTLLRSIKTDTTGRLEVVGPGVAGTPAGGVLTVQGIAGGIAVPISGTVATTQPVSATGTVSAAIAAAAANTLLLASNPGRKGATIYNDYNKKLLVKYAATASATSFSVSVPAGGYVEVPFGYTGIIDGIWPSVGGVGNGALVTEFT